MDTHRGNDGYRYCRVRGETYRYTGQQSILATIGLSEPRVASVPYHRIKIMYYEDKCIYLDPPNICLIRKIECGRSVKERDEIIKALIVLGVRI